MAETRPDPDALLARVQQEEAQKARGKLKIFFGAYPGVGKTYSMLEAAHAKRREGVDVAIGIVESHGRREIEVLLRGLEILPRHTVEYHNVTLREFDLDAALARRPALLLVDEFAHTNAPGSRHAKRCQDVQELLDRGIDVYTTLNVQHVESLNDIVAQITGITVRERVPDSSFEQADEVELVDLSPADLLQRLREGKVYVPEQTAWAAENFFRVPNLTALRELALRATADRVNAQVQSIRQEEAAGQTWPTSERFLVCVGPSPTSARLIRATRRMAAALRAEWIAAYVQTPAQMRLPEKDRARAIQHLRLTEQLGGQSTTLSGTDFAEEVIRYARARNVTKMVIGKSLRPRWCDLLFGNPVDALIRKSGDIDVYVIRGGEEERWSPLLGQAAAAVAEPGDLKGHLIALGIVALSTLICWLVRLLAPNMSPINLVMIYLLGVVAVAARSSRWPAALASVLSVLAFDFFFVPPQLTFAVNDTQYVLTFVAMLAVALVISTLTLRIRRQAEMARLRERRTAALHSLSQHLARTRGADKLLEVAVEHIAEIFESQVVALLPDEYGTLQIRAGHKAEFALNPKERSVAHWVYDLGQMAGRGTQTLSLAEGLYVPLRAAGVPLGVLGVRPADPGRLLIPEQLHLLEAFANQAALALERGRLEQQAREAQVQIEAERLRSSLLSSVSHDLRTPLATITGSASTILESGAAMPPETVNALARDIYAEADRLSHLIGNLLQMTRLQAGAVKVHKQRAPLEEVIGAATTRLGGRLCGRPVQIRIPADLPMVPLDEVLMEQVFINLLENAAKYTPDGTPIDMSAWQDENSVVMEVADRGDGLDPAEIDKVFEVFYRGRKAGRKGGAGLGLAICRGIIQAHGGRIWALNRPEGGVAFRFSLPLNDAHESRGHDHSGD
jgi:two-component system sensor histidine kinase KdpD